MTELTGLCLIWRLLGSQLVMLHSSVLERSCYPLLDSHVTTSTSMVSPVSFHELKDQECSTTESISSIFVVYYIYNPIEKSCQRQEKANVSLVWHLWSESPLF